MCKKNYFEFAKADYMMLSSVPDYKELYDNKVSLYCQCIEKLLKGLIIYETNEVPDRTHKLQVLAKKLMDKGNYDFLKSYRGTLNILTNAYFDRRYPGDGYYELDEDEYLDIKNTSEELISILRDLIPADEEFYKTNTIK
ncbi:MAG: HEPN domain-containing protein [Romboutsia sp.]|uniref:HEPN domain-containing protein n=1 Tax=Romboutsia sp. TaxID=1965302 RepID=UPI003F418D8B